MQCVDADRDDPRSPNSDACRLPFRFRAFATRRPPLLQRVNSSRTILGRQMSSRCCAIRWHNGVIRPKMNGGCPQASRQTLANASFTAKMWGRSKMADWLPARCSPLGRHDRISTPPSAGRQALACRPETFQLQSRQGRAGARERCPGSAIVCVVLAMSSPLAGDSGACSVVRSLRKRRSLQLCGRGG